MPTIFIYSESINADAVACDCCGCPASHVEMDYYHNHDAQQHAVVCLACATRGEFDFCPCCPLSEPFECENDDGVKVMLYPVFTVGELDSENCCSEHP
ncbi:hypothetical protein BCC1697_001361 [Burkholderia gladioli]|uniref:hypothetical protein n=1 Tax=Burkholderia glumae TaxID=337 RepID=UPI0020370858|nr:hypothetical protein [Burkholderia glumae]